MLFSSERNLFISYDRQVFWLVIFSPSQNARVSVDHWKDLQNDSNDFTAAGTAPEFHRIPFSSNMKAPRRLQIYKYYFEAIPFLATFATKKKEN